MCIIIAKPIGANLPPIEHIRQSFNNNSHGFACMWVNKKEKIEHYKTMSLLKCISFYKYLLEDKEKWKGIPMTFHFRLATHGSKNIQNCHAFMDDCKTVGFQHNGVLGLDVPKGMDITDSEYFFKFLFLPLYKLNKNEMNFDHVIDNMRGSGWDRFAFLRKNKIHLYGVFSELNGCYYSNRTYEPNKYNFHYNKINGYGV